MTKSRHTDPETSSPQRDELERVLDRVSASVDEQLPGILQEIDEAAALLAEIFGTPEPARRALIESGVRFHSLQLSQLLEERSRDLWFSAPARVSISSRSLACW